MALLSSVRHSLPNDSWFVVQVMPRSDARVASILGYKGYEPFAPTYASSKRWSDRVKTLERPLFPGYVFVRTPRKTATGLLCSTPGVIRILGVSGQPTAIPETEMEAVRRLALFGKPLPTAYLNVGEVVEIKDGPFAGIVGTIRQIKGRTSLVVSVQLISQSICIDVHEFQIGRVGSANRPAVSAAAAGG